MKEVPCVDCGKKKSSGTLQKPSAPKGTPQKKVPPFNPPKPLGLPKRFYQ